MNMQEEDRWLAESRRRDEKEVALKIELGILKYRLELAEAALQDRVTIDRKSNPEPWRGVRDVIDDVEVTPLGSSRRAGGMFTKFRVVRVDERDAKGGDKADAQYFVLDYVHDLYARKALAFYAACCEEELSALASDLRAALIRTARDVVS